MTRKPTVCTEIDADLIASATGEADVAATRRVEIHLAGCPGCREAHAGYRALEGMLQDWRVEAPDADAHRARSSLTARLADLRRRTLLYRVFPSPLGRILIARSEDGVSLIEYAGDLRRSRLAHAADLELREDGAEIETLHHELLEYLDGRRTRLDWPLDLRLARSDFHRAVLHATAAVPYGAVVSYSGIACDIGKPAATRAVAQALRWNPLPIVVPCHRVVGASGALTGYAGDKLDLKRQLLELEGVRACRGVCLERDAMYVGYPGSTEYCLPTCAWCQRFEHPHRLRFFGSRERAESAGLGPCTDCRPDLHPLPA